MKNMTVHVAANKKKKKRLTTVVISIAKRLTKKTKKISIFITFTLTYKKDSALVCTIFFLYLSKWNA